MNERVGFIGLGIMGRPMALNLVRAGYRLSVHARREVSMEPLIAAGAEACASPAEVARRADIIFVMVADTPDVEQVVLGKDGVRTGVRAGALVVDMSTISPAATRAMAARLREHGAEMLDAPVSGGETGAIEGALSIMVGGTEAAFARARPLFEVLGRNIVHVGGNGAGQVCKACNQIAISQAMAGVGEAILLARAEGVDPMKMRAALLGGSANNKVLELHGRRMIEADYRPGFKAGLHRKDLRIVLEAADELGIALPGTALASQYLNALVGRGHGDLDSCALFRVLEELGGSGPNPAG
ncbi:MAG: NAD(P)-dependent oxidoreductase [Candidatus Thiosymbion ectosymbiont of Robbea hypermnestra]|nr:NAD(P)-dependent oxidoreductase [Candidatus Thiosymbion ectosymbiont of Robbea hypermnestra]